MRCLPAALGFFLLGLCISCGGKTEERIEQRPVPVRAAEVKIGTRHISVHTSGTVAGKETARLSFKISGIIERIGVREGDFVQKGVVLAALNQTEARAIVHRTEAAFEKARQDLTNDEKLYAENVISEERLLHIRKAWKTARANLEIAEHNLVFASILAPADGRILNKLGEVNEVIQAGRPLFLFSVASPNFVFHAGLTDRDIVRLSMGDSATVFLDAHPNLPIPAAVSELPAASDPATGLYPVELTLFHGDVSLLQGMHGRVEIRTQHSAEGPVIPMDALVNTDRDHGEVYVLEGTLARKRAVILGPVSGHKIVVRRGLSPGEVVVIEGAGYLRDKSAVKIISSTEHKN